MSSSRRPWISSRRALDDAGLAALVHPMAKPASQPPLDPARAFADAVSLYRQGRLDDAEKIAARIHKALPQSSEVLHLLGVIKLGRHHPAAALPLIEAALKLDPRAHDAWSS